jgi:hypothetical protein
MEDPSSIRYRRPAIRTRNVRLKIKYLPLVTAFDSSMARRQEPIVSQAVQMDDGLLVIPFLEEPLDTYFFVTYLLSRRYSTPESGSFS